MRIMLRFVFTCLMIYGCSSSFVFAQDVSANPSATSEAATSNEISTQQPAQESTKKTEPNESATPVVAPTDEAVSTEQVTQPAEVSAAEVPAEAPVDQTEPTDATVEPTTEAQQADQTQTTDTTAAEQPEAPSTETPTEEKPPVEEAQPVEPAKEAPKETEPPKEEPPIEIEEIEGIDTVDLQEPRGNWLFKRIWWERAENKYEKIRALAQEILESRMKFFTQRTEIDRKILDPFYMEIGLSKGEFQEVILELTKKLEQERAKDEQLTAEERDLLTTLQQESKLLEQLGIDIQAIGKLDNSIDDALSQLMDQVNRVRGYERDAWRYFKEISRVLSDKQARALFYKMEIILNNMKDIKDYVQQPFAQHFNQVITAINQNVGRIKLAVQEFKDKGVNFKSQAEQMFEVPQVSKSTKQKEVVVEEEDEEEEEEQQGWFGSTMSMLANVVVTVWDYIVYLVKLPYNYFFGAQEAAEEEELEEEEQVVTQPSNKEIKKQETITKQAAPMIPQSTIQIPPMPQVPVGQEINEVEETEEVEEATEQPVPADALEKEQPAQQQSDMQVDMSVEEEVSDQSQDNTEAAATPTE